MFATTLRLACRAAFALAANCMILTGLQAPAAAGEASAWDGGSRAAVRLIAGSNFGKPETRIVRAGVEIKLGAGWKTYWRYPGDSGVPPRFNFDRSENVATISVSFPAPHGFSDDGGRSIGYKDSVILPLQIVPKEPGKPVVLRLDLDYAICEKLCVPAEAKAELALTRNDGVHEAALAASEARVPKRVAIGQGERLAIKSVTRQDTGKRPLIIVDLAASEGAEIELFAEGPTPDWSLPVPEPITGGADGLRRFAFELDGLPPGASARGATLKLTAASREATIEVVTSLD